MKAKNKSSIAKYYGVSLKTLNVWLENTPDLYLEKGQRVLTPRQIKILKDHLGDPTEN